MTGPTGVGSFTKGGNSSQSNTAISVNTDSGKLIGDLVVVFIDVIGAGTGGGASPDANGWTAGAYNGSPTVSPPDGTWTLLGDQAFGAGGHTAVYLKTATTNGVSTYAFTLASGAAHVWTCRVARTANGCIKLGSGKGTTSTSPLTAGVSTSEASEYVLRHIGGKVASGSTSELGTTWDAAVGNVTNVQGSGSGTGTVFGSSSDETVASAGAVAGRTISLPNTPVGWGTVTLGLTVAAASAPVNTSAPVISGTAKQGQTGTGSDGTWSGSPSPTFTYQWNRNGSPISGATSSTYVYTSADVGQSITFTVTGSNIAGTSSATSASVTPVTGIPVNTGAPAITGTAAQGQTGTCSTGSWNNTPTSYAYQWRRNGGTISGATTSTYVYTSSDVAQTVDCVVTATNTYGSASATSGTVTPTGPPTLNVAPVLTGTFYAGHTITCGTGSWNGTPTNFAYQWRRNGVSISGATTNTFALTQTDVAQSIDCIVTATNAGGSTPTPSNAVVPGTAAGLLWNTLTGSRFSSHVWH